MLAALVGSEVDNALIQVNGPEMPIMDGSSIAFVEGILKIGIEELDAEKEFLKSHIIFISRTRKIKLKLSLCPLTIIV